MTFDDWLNETEGYSSRLERAYEELVSHRYVDNHTFWKTVLLWLNTAYSIGNNAGQNNTELAGTIHKDYTL